MARPGHLRVKGGTSLRGPISRKHWLASQRQEVTGFAFRDTYRTRFHQLYDFDGPFGQTLADMDLASVITKTAGTPTVAIVANTLNGELAGTLDNTNELQRAGISLGDQLIWGKVDVASPDLIGGPFFEARVKTSTIAANQGLIIGIATAYNSTLASITKYAWFRLTGNMNLTLETNDGTTVNSAVVPLPGTTPLTAATYYDFTIDFSDPTAVEFWLGVYGALPVATSPGSQAALAGDVDLGTLSMAALAVTDVFQPLILVTKESGTGVPAVTIDYLSWFQNRM